MKSAPHFRSQAVSLARNSCALLRAAVVAFAIIIAISVASSPLSAQDQANSDNRAGLNGVLHAIAAGSKVSPRVSLRLQVGFFAGQPERPVFRKFEKIVCGSPDLPLRARVLPHLSGLQFQLARDSARMPL
jgi:hypothetical protein